MQTINRKELIKQLVSVIPGLSVQEILEQSSCFAFLNEQVITFNGDAACRMPCCLDIRGAVPSKPLLDILKARPEEELKISCKGGKFIIRGRGRRISQVTMEKKITLPFRDVIEPKEWFKLPSNFLEAVDHVHQCCGKDQDHLETFVHITPLCIEAIGKDRVGHYRIKTPLKNGVLLHKDSIRHVVPLGMTECGTTRGWTHFRNETGIVLSCRRWPGEKDYPNTAKIVKTKGKQINLPKGLDKAINRAYIFSRDNAEDTDVEITLKPGEAICKGEGALGMHEEPRKIEYTGDKMTFSISPDLLTDLCHKHTEAWVTPRTLTVKSGRFTFVTALGVEDNNTE